MKTLLQLLFLSLAIAAQAQVIPASNRVSWDNAGCHFAFPEPQLTANVMAFGAHADGVNDDVAAITNAIASLNGHYGVVYLPSGTYLMLSTIDLPDSVIIRGAGADSTFLKINSTVNGFTSCGNITGTFTKILSGFNKESQKITVANCALFSTGNDVEMHEDNGSWDTSPATWAVQVVGQISKVTNIIGDTLFLEDKLRIDFDTSLNLEIQKIIPATAISIENLNIERTDTSTSCSAYNIDFVYAKNCRVKCIESNKSEGSHCMIYLSSHIDVSGSYFHDAYKYDGGGTRGYGVTLDQHSGLCLITNNVFRHLRHAMMTKAGANGNVFAYNYSREVYRNGAGEFPTDYAGDIQLHGHYSFANLFEGNIVQNLQIDNTWGPSGPYNTFFRNRIEHYGIYMTTTLTNNSNFVGNETIGSFPYGFYTLTGTGNFQYGNNINGTVTPAGTTPLNDTSYFYMAEPPFWNITNNWPTIGISNALNSGTIPAEARYLAGFTTACSDTVVTGITKNEAAVSIKINPNPANDFIVVEINSCKTARAVMTISDPQGKLIMEFKMDIQNGNNEKTINVTNLAKGIYFIKATTDFGSCSQKLIVN